MQATQDQTEQIVAPIEEVQLKKEETIAAEEVAQAESTTREASSEGEPAQEEAHKEDINKEESNQEETNNEEINKEEANKEENNTEEAVKEEVAAAEPVQAEPLSQHAIAINDAIRLFNELIPVDKWEFYGDTNGIKTYTKLDVASGLKMARGDGFILKPLEAIEKHVLDVNSVPKWAGNLQSHQIVEENDYTVYRSLNSKVMFVAQRETVVATKIIKREDGSSLVVQRSTTHADWPETNNFVRAQVNLFAWLLTPDQENANKTNVTSIIFVDPKGWVPIPVFNAFIHDQAQSVKKLKDFVEKM